MMPASSPVSVNQCVERHAHRVHVHLYTVALKNDSRFLKEARSLLRADLAEEVFLVGQTNLPENLTEDVGTGIHLVRFRNRLRVLPKFKLFGCLKYCDLIRCQLALVRQLRPGLVHCHSVSSLPAAILAKRRHHVPVIYDARELETEANGLRGINQVFARKLERVLVKHCDAVLCVSESIADWYAQTYGIRRPFVVRNVPDLREQRSLRTSDSLHQRLRIEENGLLFLYSGALCCGRRIEQMIRVFSALTPKHHLVFMGFGPLAEMAQRAARAFDNIHFLPAVAPDSVIAHVSSADVGLVGVENRCLSYYLSLPNKLFEYLLAGIPFLAPDYPEMRRVLQEHGCGWVVGESDDNWRSMVLSLDKQRALKCRQFVSEARRRFSWENEEQHLLEAYGQALNHSGFQTCTAE